MPRASPPFRSRPRPRWLASAEEGVAAVEFALLAPVLIVVLLGVLDTGWRLLAEYRLTRATSALAELVARTRELHEADIADAFRAALEVAAPFGADGDAALVVSGVLDATGRRPLVLWQRRFPVGTGRASRVGAPGGPADLGTLDLGPGDSVIVAEVFATFEPLVGFVFREPEDLYHRWIVAPRFGALTEVLP